MFNFDIQGLTLLGVRAFALYTWDPEFDPHISHCWVLFLALTSTNPRVIISATLCASQWSMIPHVATRGGKIKRKTK